jgi:ribose/xylose/arabinose/galactoside ABC-type transport system permease subunit
MKDVWSKLALGVFAGFLGAVAMSLFMAVGKALGLIHYPKPHQIEDRIEEKTGTQDDFSPKQGVFLAQAMHMVIGAGYGAGYGLLEGLVNLPALIMAPIYGLVVYVINEIIAGPSLDLTPFPTQESRPRVLRRVLMHLLFGIVLGTVMQISRSNQLEDFIQTAGKQRIRIG